MRLTISSVKSTPKNEAGSPAEQVAIHQSAAFRRPWIAFGVLLVVLVSIGVGAYVWYQQVSAAQEKSRLELQGNIDVRQVNLSFKVDGRIVGLKADEGDSVKSGQVIAELDPQYFDDGLLLAKAQRDNAAANLARLEHGSRPEEIAEAKALVAQQKSTLALAEQEFRRSERLLKTGVVNQENFDQTKAALGESEAKLKYAEVALQLTELGPRKEDIDAARAQLAAQDAMVIQAERRRTDSRLIAPDSGVILTRAREKGAIVGAGETVFTLTLASPVWVRTYVNEVDLGRIRPGMRATIRTDSRPDKPYQGQIGFISPKAEFTPKSVETRELRTQLVYRLRVIVDDPDGGLRQGMPVTVTLDLDHGK